MNRQKRIAFLMPKLGICGIEMVVIQLLKGMVKADVKLDKERNDSCQSSIART